MERKQCVYVTRAAGASIMACLALLCVPAASIAADPANLPAEGAGHTSELLARGAGYGQREDEAAVRALQRRLRALGQRPGPVDGLYGPLTESAVEDVQRESGLSVDGVVGPQTRRVLNTETPPLVPGAGYGRPGGSPQVRAVQRSLRSAGQRPGPVDGLYGPRTEAAVARFQRTAGQPRAECCRRPRPGRLQTPAATGRPRVRDAPPAIGRLASEDSGLRAGPRLPGTTPASPVTRTAASRANGRIRAGDGTREAADGRVERTVGAEPSSPLHAGALALALSAIGGLLVVGSGGSAASPRRARRRSSLCRRPCRRRPRT